MRIGKCWLLALALVLSAPQTQAAESTYKSWTMPRFGKGGGYAYPRISRDGNSMAAAAATHNQELYFYVKNSDKPQWVFEGGTEINLDLAISGDGEYIAGSGSRIMVFHRSSNKPYWSYKPDSPSHFYSVDISPDGQYLAACGMRIYDNKGVLLLFGMHDGKPLKAWEIDGIPRHVDVSLGAKYIAVGTDKGVTYVDCAKPAPAWNYATLAKDGVKPDSVVSFSMSDDGGHLAAATYHGSLYSFGSESCTPLWSFKARDFPDSDASVSDDGKDIILASGGDYMEFSGPDSEPLWKLNYDGAYADTGISSDGKFIAISDSNAHRIYFFDRDYASGDGQRPFRIYPSVFPSGLSLSADGGDVIFDEKDLQYKEVPPGLIVEVKDLVRIYQAGSVVNLRAHLPNPGKENILKLDVRLTVLPTEVMMSDIEEMQGKENGIISKIRTVSEGIGSVTAWEMPVVIDAHSSKDLDIRFPIPRMLVPKVVQDAKNKWGDIKKYVNSVRKYANARLPKPAADELNSQLIDPALKEIKKAEEDAKKAYMQGVESDTSLAVPIPMMAFGIVSIYEDSTGAFLDRDTYIFFYVMSTKDLIPE
ncbi:MAG: WD40 repeat domain-containing protein [Dehalococcoidales bacterium]|jgi:WD40 repeat protein